jgi:hypothetical protein
VIGTELKPLITKAEPAAVSGIDNVVAMATITRRFPTDKLFAGIE